MNASQIRAHWTERAQLEGERVADVRPSSIKSLEVDALVRAIVESELGHRAGARVLEVGCGTARNLVALADRFPELRFTGVDFVPEMLSAARRNVGEALRDRIELFEGDALALGEVGELAPSFDVIFTDRCLVNLESADAQRRALAAMAARLAPGGYLLLLENSTSTFEFQNDCREVLDLQRRRPADVHCFLDEGEIVPYLETLVELVTIEDFASLHDLVLYALVPAVNGGEIDYDHPLVQAAASLSRGVSQTRPSTFGPFGQCRLFVCRKRPSESL